ncbi:uncharacterized protein LOC113354858 [Papaver somniferum]|uniref:uncharacterized protein LOC113354858 n=1 Tax=Papaver somniferum TaxID=3469 RepID=UPI000E6F949F|nr:uncharacterized protein LOC113354858 [Papaver somniferum]
MSLMILKENCCWEVGDGLSINFRKDIWLPNQLEPLDPSFNEFENQGALLVAHFLIGDCWNVPLLSSFFSPSQVLCILTIKPNPSKSDTLRWNHSADGIFTTKSLYNVLVKNDIQPVDKTSSKIWKLGALPRIKMFAWKLYTDILPFSGHLAKYLQHIDPTCTLCNNAIETSEHVFLHCPFSRAGIGLIFVPLLPGLSGKPYVIRFSKAPLLIPSTLELALSSMMLQGEPSTKEPTLSELIEKRKGTA